MNFCARTLHFYVNEHLSFEEIEDLIESGDLVTLSCIQLKELFISPIVDEVFRMSIVLEITIITTMGDYQDAIFRVPHL